MSNHLFAGVLFAGLLTAVGCDKSSPTGPTQLGSPAALTVTSVSPSAGPTGSAVEVRIFGTGFQRGATVTLDGAATNVTVVHSALITASTPLHEAGTVDVVVTNPAGQSVRLPEAYTYAPLGISAVSPKTGLIGDVVRIVGTGFAAGATVTFGSVSARVVDASGTVIRALAPVHVVGPVDVVVTNPDGQRGMLTDGYVYDVVTLSVSSNAITSGSPMIVSWVAPAGRSVWDWIGLFKVGDSNAGYGWYDYTKGATSGMLTLTAPTQAGQYEFRYLLDDGYVDAARSGQVTVKAGGEN